MKSVVLLLLFSLAAAPALAAPAISCHCFQDRSFDPQRPAAADPYLLATTQNSLLASAFGLPKKELVRAKMSGASGERLWVVHYLADRSGRTPEAVAAAGAGSPGWRETVASLGIDPALLAPGVVARLAQGADEPDLAAAIVDAVLAERLGAAPDVLERLRQNGAGDQETIVAVFLSRRTGRPAAELLAAVRTGEASWGSLAATAGLEPAAIDEAIAGMLR